MGRVYVFRNQEGGVLHTHNEHGEERVYAVRAESRRAARRVLATHFWRLGRRDDRGGCLAAARLVVAWQPEAVHVVDGMGVRS